MKINPLRLLSVLILVIELILILVNFNSLPATIPIHYDLAGNADGYGDRSMLFVLFGISVVVFLLITWLSRFKKKYNYPFEIRNIAESERLSGLLTDVLCLNVVLIFLYLVAETIYNIKLYGLFILLLLMPFFITLVFLYKIWNVNKEPDS